MMVHLLDVNVLIALMWRNNPVHELAHTWFKSHADGGWATCPITQCGFVRISSNPRALPSALKPASAIEVLERFANDSRHVFWNDDLSLSDLSRAVRIQLAGHQQVTDAYLIALARRHGGRLVTLDRAAAKLGAGDVELLAP